MSTDDAMTTTAPRDSAAFDGNRPKYSGDWRDAESAGIVPVPLANRYGTAGRMFPVWAGPNMGISAVFIGTVGALLLGLSFGQTEIALILGIVIGAIPVAALCTMGPRTGTGQLPFARLPFGRGAILPGTFQWASAVGWVAIGCLFGAQAAHLLFHVPFWAGALIVVAATMAISIRGYEAAVLAQITGTVVMPILFAILTWRIFSSHHIVLAHATVHGGAATGAFILMVTVAASGSFSWASYAADYSRYLPGNTSSRRVFWYSLAGLLVAFIWLGSIGAAASSVLGDQTAAGIRNLMGGGALGELALIAIVFAAIISSVMNDYSGSLALQTVEIRVKRPYLSAIGGLLAFGLIMWVNAGNTSGRLTNILLLTAYWCAPFAAIVGVDWWWRRRQLAQIAATAKDTGQDVPGYVQDAMAWHNLPSGWRPVVAFALACGAMVPFMNTYYVYGAAARAMNGADISYIVGAIIAGALYVALLLLARQPYGAHARSPAAVRPARGGTV